MGDETIKLQITQFLDDWHYRVMHSSLGKQWTRDKVIISALELMMLNGVPLTPQDIKWMSEQHEDLMIPELIKKMPFSIRENFDSLASQLRMLLLTAIRVRRAADEGSEDAIAEVMEEEDHGSIKEQILKEAVIQASKEVSHAISCRDTWVKSTERRLARLTRSAELAEAAQQQLLKVEAQLESFSDMSKTKIKKALMGFVNGSERNVLQSCLVNWAGLAMKNRDERAFRKKFEEELTAKETMLMQMKSKAIQNVKAALQRKLLEGDEDIIASTFQEWRLQVGSQKREKEEEASLKTLQEQMGKFSEEKAANAKRVMAQMAMAGEEQTLVAVFQSWVQATSELKLERGYAEQVQKAEKQFQEYMGKKKEDAKAMLTKMGHSTATGLLQSAVQGWFSVAREGKEVRRVQREMNDADTKFSNLKAKQKGAATQIQGRVNEQIKANLLARVMGAWELTSKVNRIDKYYKAKMDGKRKQLDSVRTLFRSFADKLEEGLSNVDGDSSGRETRSRRTKPGLARGGEHSVSLPDIHARQ